MKTQVLLGAALVGATCWARPSIVPDSVTFAQDAESRIVTVTYRLADGPAIVTMSVETNAGETGWVDIGAAHVAHLVGAVNRVVSGEAVQTVLWQPDADWPGVTLANGAVRVVFRAWPVDNPPDYMAVDLSSPATVRYYASAEAVPGGVGDARWKTDMLLMRRVRAAGVEWMMGAPASEPGTHAADDDKWGWTLETPHAVTLTRDYYIGVYTVTQRQWMRVKNISKPDYFESCEHGDEGFHPATRVSPRMIETDSGCFLERLRTLTGLSTFNLPTSAEWEYACRAGTRTGLYTGTELASATASTDATVDRIAWYTGNSGGRVHAVGQKLPNAWGLYDMIGNVEEYSRDYFRRDLGTADAVDPCDPASVEGEQYGFCHATGGGHFGRPAYRLRSSCRNAYEGGSDSSGFRVICYVHGN